MGVRILLCKDLAAGSNSASVYVRDPRPFTAQVEGTGMTGTVDIEHSAQGPGTADASATWRDLVANAADGSLNSIDTPIYRVRVEGSHSAGTVTVTLIADP